MEARRCFKAELRNDGVTELRNHGMAEIRSYGYDTGGTLASEV